MNRLELYEMLKARLSESDLQEICFNLEIDFENLDGEVKNDKIRALILFLERRERLDELTDLLEPRTMSVQVDLTVLTQSKMLIGSGKLDQAIQVLRAELPSGTLWEQKLLSISGQYTRYHADRLKGILSSEADQVTFSRITDALLQLIGRLSG